MNIRPIVWRGLPGGHRLVDRLRTFDNVRGLRYVWFGWMLQHALNPCNKPALKKAGFD